MAITRLHQFNRNQVPAYDISDGDTDFDEVIVDPLDNWCGVEVLLTAADAAIEIALEGTITGENWVEFTDTRTSITAGDTVAQLRVMDIPIERIRLTVDVLTATSGVINKINYVLK